MAAKIELTDICAKKSAFLVDKGMIPYGLILQRRLGSGDYERATVDKFGRVQWWKIDGSGKMFAEHAIGELKAQIKILDDLLYEKEAEIQALSEKVLRGEALARSVMTDAMGQG